MENGNGLADCKKAFCKNVEIYQRSTSSIICGASMLPTGKRKKCRNVKSEKNRILSVGAMWKWE